MHDSATAYFRQRVYKCIRSNTVSVWGTLSGLVADWRDYEFAMDRIGWPDLFRIGLANIGRGVTTAGKKSSDFGVLEANGKGSKSANAR